MDNHLRQILRQGNNLIIINSLNNKDIHLMANNQLILPHMHNNLICIVNNQIFTVNQIFMDSNQMFMVNNQIYMANKHQIILHMGNNLNNSKDIHLMDNKHKIIHHMGNSQLKVILLTVNNHMDNNLLLILHHMVSNRTLNLQLQIQLRPVPLARRNHHIPSPPHLQKSLLQNQNHIQVNHQFQFSQYLW